MATTAYGFISLESLYNQRVVSVGPTRIFKAVEESAAEYTRVADSLFGEFYERTITGKEQIELPGDSTLQPLDEDGNPKPVEVSGSYDVAYPIQGAGTAWGTNRVSRALMTVSEANKSTIEALQSDKDWMIRHVLAAVLDNATWTYTDKVGPSGSKGLGSLTIQPLANGDSVVYKRRGGAAPSADTHYLAQANAIDNSNNPFPTIQSELQEHPSNGKGDILVYVSSSLVSSIQGLSAFTDKGLDANINVGASSDTLSNVPDIGPGDRLVGYIEGTGCWVIEWSDIPTGYMIAKMAGKPFLKMREYDAPELQGFFPEAHNVDGNHQVNRMLRYAGFGVADRIAALAYRVGNAAYAVPSGFDAPLPV